MTSLVEYEQMIEYRLNKLAYSNPYMYVSLEETYKDLDDRLDSLINKLKYYHPHWFSIGYFYYGYHYCEARIILIENEVEIVDRFLLEDYFYFIAAIYFLLLLLISRASLLLLKYKYIEYQARNQISKSQSPQKSQPLIGGVKVGGKQYDIIVMLP